MPQKGNLQATDNGGSSAKVPAEKRDRIVEQMKAGAGISEELKVSDQMKWVGLMNNVRNSVEEIILKEFVYC